MTLTSDPDPKTLMEAIPYETKIFLLVVAVAALVIFVVVLLMDSKPQCRCFDFFSASLIDYGKTRAKKVKSARRKSKQGMGILSKPLGSSLSSSSSSSEQDSDDDVAKSYQKSVAISRQSVCPALIASGSLQGGKQNGVTRKTMAGGKREKEEEEEEEEGEGEGVVVVVEVEKRIDVRERKEDSSGRVGVLGVFKKKDRKPERRQEREGLCFKNEVFTPSEETSPPSMTSAKIFGARSFTDLTAAPFSSSSGSSSFSPAIQSRASTASFSPLKTFWNKLNSRSTSRLNNDPISLNLTLTYFETENELEVKIIEAKDVPHWAVVTRVKMTLLPAKREKFETKPRPGARPVYNESTRFKVHPSVDVNCLVLRVRMYGGENRSSLLGWKLINFTRVLRTKSTQFWICLESEKGGEEKLKSSSMQSIVSCGSGQKFVSATGRSAPEILLGLFYNVLTGCMKVHVVAGTQLVDGTSMGKGDPKVYVKLSIMADKGQEITHSRTTSKSLQNDTDLSFQETFAFQLPLCQLESVTLVVNAFKVANKRKEMIGWFALGRNSSGEAETQHWIEMKNNKEEEVIRWHPLLE